MQLKVPPLRLHYGYYQIAIYKDKTCLITPFGTYRFNRMLFGLRNGLAIFQRMIDRFKSAIPKTALLAYLDDLIICSPSSSKHLEDIDAVFEKLSKFKLHVNN